MTKELTYAQKCGKKSKELDIPFDVTLALSPEFAEEFKLRYDFLVEHTKRCGPPLSFTIDGLKGHNSWKPLKTDLYTIKETLIALLEPSNAFRVYIEGLGYQHTKRIADHLLLL